MRRPKRRRANGQCASGIHSRDGHAGYRTGGVCGRPRALMNQRSAKRHRRTLFVTSSFHLPTAMAAYGTCALNRVHPLHRKRRRPLARAHQPRRLPQSLARVPARPRDPLAHLGQVRGLHPTGDRARHRRPRDSWADVDLKAGPVLVRRGVQPVRHPSDGTTIVFTSLKTERSRRIVQLPTFALERIRR